jgi:phage shock protein A
MSTPIFFTTLALLLGTVLLVFAMRYVSSVLTARARLAAENSYKALAERAVALQAQHEAALTGVKAELAALSTSVAAVENILKQVG